MSRYAKLARTPVPQSEPLDERQAKNNAGGFVYTLDDFKRLDRFLILGSDAATYYQDAKKLTRENAACVERCYAQNADRTIARIAEISDEGRAPKNDAAIFALALGAASQDVQVRQRAFAALPVVCRTSTHLFQFVDNCRALGKGWGRAFKRAVARWYDHRSPASVAYQGIKYRSREGYTHKRLLETARPFAAANQPVYRWLKGKSKEGDVLPSIIAAHEAAMKLTSGGKDLIKLIKYNKLPWEAIPTEVKKDPEVWKAMLPDLGLTALIRNLGAMTAYGALKPLSKEVQVVVERLSNQDELKKARIHPFNVLLALSTYRGGHSLMARRFGRDGLSWQAIPAVSDMLEEAFYNSFKYVEPTGKRFLIGLDVSGSMSSSLMGSPLQVNEGAAAMAMTVARSEKNYHIMAFDQGIRELPITAKTSLAGVLKHTKDINGGGTDCALPMRYALDNKLEVDVFQVYTDNETWAGREHPVAVLKEYRRKTGIPAKLIVVGMTATNFTIADPSDGGMLDIVGFDSAAPAVMAEFARV